MTSIISAISGQFSKSLVLGTLFPVALFVVLALMFVLPIVPSEVAVLAPLQKLGTEWQLIALSLVTVVISGVLYNLNIPIIRLYEGYPWRDSWLGRRRTARHRGRYESALARRSGMRTLLRALGDQHPDYDRLRGVWRGYSEAANREFPQDSNLILPTRLGNVIRSFEDYSYRQYGMESITLWPRLIAKIDKEYAAAVDAAKAGLDFSINMSFLSIILALGLLAAGLVYPVPLVSGFSFWLWLVEIVGFLALGHGAYLISLGQAGSWGELVKGTFDLYRWDLLTQLGYQHRPTTMVEERTMWNDIYLPMLFGDSPATTPLASYGPRRAFALAGAVTDGMPEVVYVVSSRATALPDDQGRVPISLEVRNVDPRGRPAERVRVTDTLPEGFDYEWNSAQRIDRADIVRVTGANPYVFEIDRVNFGETAMIQYRAVPRKAEAKPGGPSTAPVQWILRAAACVAAVVWLRRHYLRSAPLP